MSRKWEILVDRKLLKLVKRVLGIGNDAVCALEHVAHPLCVAARLSVPAIMRVGDWDEVVNEIDRSKLGPLQPIGQASRIKASMSDIQVDFTANIPFPLPAGLR
jgi:hypothetical protein